MVLHPMFAAALAPFAPEEARLPPAETQPKTPQEKVAYARKHWIDAERDYHNALRRYERAWDAYQRALADAERE